MRQAIAIVAALTAGCAATAVQKVAVGTVQHDGGYALRVSETDLVPYEGVVNFDSAGLNHGAGVLYGPGAAGFVAGLIAHGAILKGVRDGQKSEIQQKADLVLVPFAPVLQQFRQKDLVDGALADAGGSPRGGLARHGAGVAAGWLIDSAPVFSMTQDQRAIVLDHLVSITRRGTSKQTYQNSIRVISTAHTDTSPEAYWNANAGERLKAASVQLYRESLDLALRDASKTMRADAGQQKTVRYLEGRLERTERAEVLETGCDRAVIRTLRGWLMSVPLSQPPGACVVEVAQ